MHRISMPGAQSTWRKKMPSNPSSIYIGQKVFNIRKDERVRKVTDNHASLRNVHLRSGFAFPHGEHISTYNLENTSEEFVLASIVMCFCTPCREGMVKRILRTDLRMPKSVSDWIEAAKIRLGNTGQ